MPKDSNSREDLTGLTVSDIIERLYRLTDELERRHPGRRFTLDGHLVGSIGEVAAAERYGLELLPATTEGHDALGPNGELVQIKLTQRRTIGLRSAPQHLLVLRLDRDGDVAEVYNGPGERPWQVSGPRQANGQRQLGLGRLEQMMDQVQRAMRLKSTRIISEGGD